MDEDPHGRALRIALAIAMGGLAIAVVELALRYLDWPAAVYSGWQATSAAGPVNQLGYRGRPWQLRRFSDVTVLLVGADAVECGHCPADEPLDLMLERALRQYNPNARVIALGARGYGQDQQSLALQEFYARDRADLVLFWTSPAEDMARNTFRSGHPRPGATELKPTFALRDGVLIGPTETIGQSFYRSKLSSLILPLFLNPEHQWTAALPPAGPGAATAPAGIATFKGVTAPLDEQRSSWAMAQSPRSARVQYGIDLTRALLRRMRDFVSLRGGRVVVLAEPPPVLEAPAALEHDGRWFVGDPGTRDATIADLTEGFNPITVPPAADTAAERQRMAWLAETIKERGLLPAASPPLPHARH